MRRSQQNRSHISSRFSYAFWRRLLGKKVHLPRAICDGVGPAEVLAFGAAIRHVTTAQSALALKDVPFLTEAKLPTQLLDIQLVNIANWGPGISSPQSGLTTPPTLSKYASMTAKANNAPFLLPDILTASFQQCSIFEVTEEEIGSIMGKEATLIALFFSLNDLLALSVPKCTAFLLRLTLTALGNSLLLIIDSLDSPAEITLEKDDQGKERKTYLMNYLLHMILLEKRLPSSSKQKPMWENLIED